MNAMTRESHVVAALNAHGESLPALNGRWCYYVEPTQDPALHGGFVPSLVEEGKPGHWPMIGREGAAPWIWGATYAEADEVCDRVNADRGISQKDATLIVLSSMGAATGRRRVGS